MGTEYYITCKDCKVSRDLDKFYNASIHPVTTRKESLEYKEIIKRDAFRAGLLVSFMGEHQDHNCVFHSEHNEEFDAYIYSPDEKPSEYKEDTDFWANDESEINDAND